MVNRINLKEWFPEEVIRKMETTASCAVSFSGGVDSSVVLAVASQIIGPSGVHAVTFASWLHADWEMERARAFAKELRVEHAVIPGPELGIPEVVGNHPGRCALCKEARIRNLLLYAGNHSLKSVFEGSNADDIEDPTRLGTGVLPLYDNVYSPLAEAGLSKKRTRLLARELGIGWWNESATACMATRFPSYCKLDEFILRRVAGIEKTIRNKGFSQARVRVFEDMACLEFPADDLDRAMKEREFLVGVMHENGFSRVMLDLEGYVSGKKWLSKMNHPQGGSI